MTTDDELLARLDRLHIATNAPETIYKDAAALIREQAAQLEAERDKVRGHIDNGNRLMAAADSWRDQYLAERTARTEAEIVNVGLENWIKIYKQRLATVFERTREKIRSPLFQQFIKQGFWHAHHVDLVWRMDGKDITEQADWLKDLWYYVRALQPEGEESAAQTQDNPGDGNDVLSQAGCKSAAAAPYVLSKAEDAVLHEALLRSVKPAAPPPDPAILGLEQAAEFCRGRIVIYENATKIPFAIEHLHEAQIILELCTAEIERLRK